MYKSTIAIINLSTGEIHVDSAPDELVRAYLGGRGMNMAYLRHYPRAHGDPRDIDAFDPRNPLIIGAGLLTGTIAPNAARFNVSARSPESGILGDANCGGFFAAAMRKAGFDRLVIVGRAAQPSYLLLEDGQITLCDADGLWGTTSPRAQEMLRARHGSGTVSAVIGPAGENRVRMASVMTGIKNTAGRGGMRAVMGSKHLKAVVARGGEPIAVADKAALSAARKAQ